MKNREQRKTARSDSAPARASARSHVLDRPPDSEDGGEDDEYPGEEGDDKVRSAHEYLRQGDDVPRDGPDRADPAPRGGAWYQEGRRGASRDEVGDYERAGDSQHDRDHR